MSVSTGFESMGLKKGPNTLLIVAAVVIVVAGLQAAQTLLIPLVFATFIAMLSAPAVMKLHSRGVPDAIAVPLVVIAVLAALFGIGAFVGGSINRFIAALPKYQASLQRDFGGAVEWAQQYGISTESVRTVANPGAVLDVVGRTMTGIASSLSDALLIVLTVAFMLLEVSGAPSKLRRALGNPDADLSQLHRVVIDVKSYVVIKTYVSAGTGVVIGTFTAIVGIDFPVLWGLLAFLLNYVPNIGSVLAAIPAVVLALVQLSWQHALATLLGFVVVNLVIGNAIEPRLMGKRLGLSTLVVWLSLIFWGWLWGPIGMLLSVPLTMIVKIMLEHSPQFHAVAVLMDGPKTPGS